MPDQVILLGHPFGSEGERECHGERQSFGDGNDDDSNRSDQNSEEILGFRLRASRIVAETSKKLDEENGEKQKTGGTTNLRDIPCRESA